MSTRLILLSHGATGLMREGGFPAAGVGLDDGGLMKARAYRLPSPAADRMFRGVDTAIAQTADVLGLVAMVEPALAEASHGPWSGMSFVEVAAADGEGFAGWIADPTAGTPGGESLAQVCARVGAWMDDQATAGGTVLGVTSATVIRAAIAHALGIAPSATMGIDVAPLTAAGFSFNRTWRLQRLAP